MNRYIAWYLLFLLVARLQAQPAATLRRDSLLAALREAPHDTARLQACQALSRVYRNQSADSALLFGQQALVLARKLRMASAEAEALNNLGGGCRSAARNEEAIRHFEQALAMYRKLNQQDNICDCYHNLGAAYRDRGDFARASTYLLQAIDCRELLGQRAKLCSTYNNLGLVYRRQGNYAQALEVFSKAMALSQEFHDDESYIQVLTNFGNVYEKLNRHSDALLFHRRALEASLRLGDRLTTSNCYNYIGMAYQSMGRYDDALAEFGRALVLKKQLGRIRDVVIVLSNIAEAYHFLNQQEKATDVAAKALFLADSIHHEVAVCATLPILIKALMARQRSEEALAYALRFHNLAHQLHMKPEMLEANLRLAAVYHALHRDTLIYPLMAEATTLKDSLFNEELSMQIQVVQQQYELVQKERENQSLRKRNEQNTNILVRQRLIGMGIILFSLVLGLLAWFLYRESRAKQNLNTLLLATNHELQGKNKELAQLNTIKAKLLSVISHDIRSPLNSLRGMLSLLEMGHIPEQDFKRDFLGKINENVDRTLEFADNLLYWAKNQMEGLTASPQVFGVGTLAGDVLALYRPLAEKKEIFLEDATDASLAALADPEMIRTVLRNLVSNAIKFTPAQGKVRVASRAIPEDGMVCVSVQDTGVGMDAETVSQLFTSGQKNTPGTANERGAGVGLILSHDFVVRNGGTMWVESVQGQGSTFCFALPLTTAG